MKFSQYLKEIHMPRGRQKFKRQSQGLVDEVPSGRLDRLNLTDLMADYGWEPVGRGFHAHVYDHHNKNYVIKVFANDPLTKRWLKFVAANQKNPYLPKLRGRPVKVGDKINAVRMERLKPLTLTQWHEFYDMMFEDDEIDDHLRRIMVELMAYGEPDIHEENCMLRLSTKDFVIVDPVASHHLMNISSKEAEEYVKGLMV